MLKNSWRPQDLARMHGKNLADRANLIAHFIDSEVGRDEAVFSRVISGVSGVKLTVYKPEQGRSVDLINFGSNSYLGLSSRQRVLEAARAANDLYGIGICGAPVLNGFTELQRQLEIQTNITKRTESCIVFPSGFMANLAWTRALLRKRDRVFFDAEAHMSFREGLRGTRACSRRFAHNNIDDLRRHLRAQWDGDTYVFVEGLYSMRGDRPDIGALNEVTASAGAILVVDDAHGTGTSGPTGLGITEAIEPSKRLLIVGTYCKALGANGGFICGPKTIIDTLRALASPYMFSAALPPATLAAACEALKILREEPELVQALWANARLAHRLLTPLGAVSQADSPIVFIRICGGVDVRIATKALESHGYFVNAVGYPAVGLDDVGLRISISALHTEEHICGLAAAIHSVFQQIA